MILKKSDLNGLNQGDFDSLQIYCKMKWTKKNYENNNLYKV